MPVVAHVRRCLATASRGNPPLSLLRLSSFRNSRGLAAQARPAGKSGYFTNFPSVGVFGIVLGASAFASVTAYDFLCEWYYADSAKQRAALEWDDTWDDGTGFLDAVAEKVTEGIEPSSEEEAYLAAALELRMQSDAADGGFHRTGGRRILFLIRHAQPSGGASTKDALTPEGRRQAELTAEHLRSALEVGGSTVALSNIFHASSVEAKATAQIIRSAFQKPNDKGAVKVSLRETALLNEGMAIVPSPLPASGPPEVSEKDQARFEAALKAHAWRPTGEAPERVCADVVVSHGNIIRYLTCRSLQLPASAWARFRAHNCAVTRLEFDSEGNVVMHEFGATGHLPSALVTYT
eukprot:TRINITY_DN34169_c0_g1_i1.p1 TRINITY_DN34169_c0_g1~~TRINITY_DN34169_c0_g1_i1.p1  ORF type:complete len:351 (+),score=43.54 TRINITY_DN34169_c0_g1_i1:53-1105(+)